MRIPRSIHVFLNKDTFLGIIGYFNVTEEWLMKRHKIKIIPDKDNVDVTISKIRAISEYLKIPVSLFFTHQLPAFPEPPKDYRSKKSSFTKDTINSFREALFYQDILSKLTEDKLLISENFLVQDDPIKAGKQLSEILQIEHLRKKSHSSTEFLRKIRIQLEDFNIYTFKARFPPQETRGFCLSESNPPIIFINSHDNDEAKIFTTLHELGHILIGEPGVSEASSNVFYSSNPIEVWCNEFAASITIPENIIEKIQFLPEENIGFTISNLSNKLYVSKHSIAYAFYKKKKIDFKTYKEYISRPYDKSKETRRKTEFKIPRANIIRSEKGSKFTNNIMEAYRQKLFSQSEVRQILNIGDNDKAFEKLLKS